MVSKNRNASISRMTRTNRIRGQRAGIMMWVRSFQPLAPSMRPASIRFWSMDCKPAYSTRIMKGANFHASARMTVNLAQPG